MAKVLIKNNSRSPFRFSGKQYKLAKLKDKDIYPGETIELDKDLVEKQIKNSKALTAMFDKKCLEMIEKAVAEYPSKMIKVGDAEVPADLSLETEKSGLEKPVKIQDTESLAGPKGGRR